jgi:hypothetical protein
VSCFSTLLIPPIARAPIDSRVNLQPPTTDQKVWLFKKERNG